jgi:hypothetical protein
MNNNVRKYPPKSTSLHTLQSISGNHFRFNNLTICWRSKNQKSVATSTYESTYIVLALATQQWIWLTYALEELDVAVTNAATFCNNKATINVAYNHKIGDRSKPLEVAYH